MINNINNIPLLRLLLPFIGGIIGVVYLKPDLSILILSFGLALFLFLSIIFTKKINSNYKLRRIIGILIYINMLLGGAVLTSLQYKDTNSTTKVLTENNNQLLIGEIIEPTQIKARSIKAVLKN
jgi:hypothetical protein